MPHRVLDTLLPEDPEVEHVPADVEQPPWTNIEVKTVSIGGGAPARAVSIRRRADVAEPARDEPELDDELVVEARADRRMARRRRIEPQEELVDVDENVDGDQGDRDPGKDSVGDVVP